MSNPIHIGVFFDGTLNHKDMDKAEGKGTQTNIAKLYDLYEIENGMINTFYERGVGTQKVDSKDLEAIKNGTAQKSDFYDVKYDAATGWGDEGTKVRVDEALSKIEDRIKEIIKTNPEDEIKIDVFETTPLPLNLHFYEVY